MRIPLPWLNGLLRNLHRRTMTAERRREVTTEIILMSLSSSSYFLLLALSAITAAFGLLADSTAVIIGAMLLAPLMGPIFGIALGITNADERLLWKALRSEALGVGFAIGLAFLIGLLPYRPEFGPNILARTQPTIYDLMIAAAAGAAGAVAIINPRISSSLPGVAIAVALLPPLATTGICLAAGAFAGAFGAFLLFMTNLVAITVTAAATFYISGLSDLPRGAELRSHLTYRSLGISLAILVFVSWFLTRTLMTIVNSQQLEHRVRSALTAELAVIPGAELSELLVEQGSRKEGLRVVAALLVTQAFEPAEVAALEQKIAQRVRQPVYLIVRSLLSRDADRHGPVFLTQDLREQQEDAAEQGQILRDANRVLKSFLDNLPGAELEDLHWDSQGRELRMTATVRTPAAVEPAKVAQMEEAMREALRRPVRLLVRSALTRDADRSHFLYEPRSEQSPAALQVRERLREALQFALLSSGEGIALDELRYTLRNGRLKVFAVVRAPQVLDPAAVSEIELVLRESLEPQLDLLIRTEVGAEVTSAGVGQRSAEEFLAGGESSIEAFPSETSPD